MLCLGREREERRKQAGLVDEEEAQGEQVEADLPEAVLAESACAKWQSHGYAVCFGWAVANPSGPHLLLLVLRIPPACSPPSLAYLCRISEAV